MMINRNGPGDRDPCRKIRMADEGAAIREIRGNRNGGAGVDREIVDTGRESLEDVAVGRKVQIIADVAADHGIRLGNMVAKLVGPEI